MLVQSPPPTVGIDVSADAIHVVTSTDTRQPVITIPLTDPAGQTR